jgi:hypothetical protein
VVRIEEVIAENDDVPCKHCCNSNSRINNISWIELQGYPSSLFATGPHFETCCTGMVHVCDITCGWVDNAVLSYLLSTFILPTDSKHFLNIFDIFCYPEIQKDVHTFIESLISLPLITVVR